MRRAQGISINVIIIAAIALVIMVILVSLVLNAGGNINKNTSACETSGDGVEYTDWKCETSGDCGDGWIRSPTKRCDTEKYPEGTVCCIPLGG